MDIYSPKGTVVQFNETNVCPASINWGGHADPTGILEDGRFYTINSTDVRSSHTKVYLEEVPGLSFNSVWLEEVETIHPTEAPYDV